MTSQSNVGVVLALTSQPMLSLDVSVTFPNPQPKAGSAATATASISFKKTMARPRDEPLKKTLDRLQLNIAQHIASLSATGPTSKKSQGKQAAAELASLAPPVIALDSTGAKIDENSLSNEKAWPLIQKLLIGSTEIPILYNYPTVVGLKAPNAVAVNVPVVCSGITVVFAENSELVYEWRVKVSDVKAEKREEMIKATDPRRHPHLQHELQVAHQQQADSTKGDAEFRHLSSASVYTPPSWLEGAPLYFRCRPKLPGSLWTEVQLPPVGPAAPSIPMKRWDFTKLPADAMVDPADASSSSTFPPFRVVCYNILHDSFSTSNFAKTKLYPFCLEQYLDLNYRKGRIVEELRAYNADIFCLQEVGRDVYQKYFSPVFEGLGYASEFNVKTGSVSEGEAIFFNEDKFKKVSHRWVPLSYPSLSDPLHSELKASIDQHPHLVEALQKVTSIGTITVLEQLPKPSLMESGSPVTPPSPKKEKRYLIVTNCHLFFHPNGCHIRAIQLYLLLKQLEQTKAELLKLLNEHSATDPTPFKVGTVLCGDYNCSRLGWIETYNGTMTGGYELATTGSCAATNYCWKKGLKFWWGCDKGLGTSDGHEGEEAAALEAATGGSSTPTTPPPAPLAAAPAEKDSQAATGTTTPPPQTQQLGPPTDFWSGTLKLSDPVGGFHDTHIDTPMKWTNYGLHFKEIIDHIFISKGDLKVVRTIPLPSEEEISKDVAIPSAVFPSDHVALITDLAFTE